MSEWISTTLSWTAILDYLKFILIGAVVASSQGSWTWIYGHVRRFFFVSTHFEENDESYGQFLASLTLFASYSLRSF